MCQQRTCPGQKFAFTITMGWSSDIFVVKKEEMQSLQLKGKTRAAQIAAEVGRSRSTVTKSLQNHLESKQKNCWQKKITSTRNNRALEKLVKKIRFKSISELTYLWCQNVEKPVSRSTIGGFTTWVYTDSYTAMKPWSGLKSIKTELLKGGVKSSFKMSPGFVFVFGGQGPWVWRKPQQATWTSLHQVQLKTSSGTTGTRVECMSARDVETLAFLKGNIDVTAYQDALNSFLLPVVVWWPWLHVPAWLDSSPCRTIHCHMVSGEENTDAWLVSKFSRP